MDKDIIDGQDLEKHSVVSEYEREPGVSYKVELSVYIPDPDTLEHDHAQEIAGMVEEHADFLGNIMAQYVRDGSITSVTP